MADIFKARCASHYYRRRSKSKVDKVVRSSGARGQVLQIRLRSAQRQLLRVKRTPCAHHVRKRGFQ